MEEQTNTNERYLSFIDPFASAGPEASKRIRITPDNIKDIKESVKKLIVVFEAVQNPDEFKQFDFETDRNAVKTDNTMSEEQKEREINYINLLESIITSSNIRMENFNITRISKNLYTLLALSSKLLENLMKKSYDATHLEALKKELEISGGIDLQKQQPPQMLAVETVQAALDEVTQAFDTLKEEVNKPLTTEDVSHFLSQATSPTEEMVDEKQAVKPVEETPIAVPSDEAVSGLPQESEIVFSENVEDGKNNLDSTKKEAEMPVEETPITVTPDRAVSGLPQESEIAFSENTADWKNNPEVQKMLEEDAELKELMKENSQIKRALLSQDETLEDLDAQEKLLAGDYSSLLSEQTEFQKKVEETKAALQQAENNREQVISDGKTRIRQLLISEQERYRAEQNAKREKIDAANDKITSMKKRNDEAREEIESYKKEIEMNSRATEEVNKNTKNLENYFGAMIGNIGKNTVLAGTLSAEAMQTPNVESGKKGHK